MYDDIFYTHYILTFLDTFSKNNEIQNSWKSVRWESSSFLRRDRQTDEHDEANNRFSQFCECAWKWRQIKKTGPWTKVLCCHWSLKSRNNQHAFAKFRLMQAAFSYFWIIANSRSWRARNSRTGLYSKPTGTGSVGSTKCGLFLHLGYS